MTQTVCPPWIKAALATAQLSQRSYELLRQNAITSQREKSFDDKCDHQNRKRKQRQHEKAAFHQQGEEVYPFGLLNFAVGVIGRGARSVGTAGVSRVRILATWPAVSILSLHHRTIDQQPQQS
ncbi:MAG: hypothetical protein IH991_12035 [Planctomycetes bacterium]|nr:hypothetical protein [Planctomycetota bacterium]